VIAKSDDGEVKNGWGSVGVHAAGCEAATWWVCCRGMWCCHQRSDEKGPSIPGGNRVGGG
jgi:hypothetical protein